MVRMMHAGAIYDSITTHFAFLSPLTYLSVMVDASPWIQPLHSNKVVSNDIDWHWRTIPDTLILFFFLQNEDRVNSIKELAFVGQ